MKTSHALDASPEDSPWGTSGRVVKYHSGGCQESVYLNDISKNDRYTNHHKWVEVAFSTWWKTTIKKWTQAPSPADRALLQKSEGISIEF